MRAAEVVVTSEQRATLQSWLAAGKTEQRLAFRTQIILALAEGLSNKATAGRLATRPATVSKWRGRFARQGLAGVADAPRSGKPRHYPTNDERRIIAVLDASPPAGYARWNGTLLAKHLGDISKHQIWRVLREHEISLERRRSWCISTDPALAQKAADIVALYLQPPENAVVLSVDEKPHIQALERAQGGLKLPNGKALTGSWLNQVEVWFSILSSHALAGTSFTSPRQVRDQIDAFITAYNQDAHPFEWTKQVVFSKHPRSSYANLRN